MSVSSVGLPPVGPYGPTALPAAPVDQGQAAPTTWGGDSYGTQAAPYGAAPAPYATAPSVDSYATTGMPADPNAMVPYATAPGVDSYATSTGYPPETGAPLEAQNAAPAGGILGGIGLGRLLSWAGGAFAAFKWVLPMLGKSPAGWAVAAVVGGGAFAGNWLYGKLTGK